MFEWFNKIINQTKHTFVWISCACKSQDEQDFALNCVLSIRILTKIITIKKIHVLISVLMSMYTTHGYF